MRFLLFLLLFLLAAPSTAVAETLLVKKTAFVYKTLETATSVKALRDAGADETKIAEFSLFKLACLSRPGDTLAVIQRTDTAALIVVANSPPQPGWLGSFGCRGWVLLDGRVESPDPSPVTK